MDPKGSGYWKFVGVFIALVALGTGAFIFSIWLRARSIEKSKQLAPGYAEELKKENEANYQIALKDTYGGKTPQETLRLYIDAVEKGDYVLASKYFLTDYQDKELRNLQSIKRENIGKYINLLKMDLSGEIVGSFSVDKTEYGIQKPFLIDFKLYPRGNWKIVRI